MTSLEKKLQQAEERLTVTLAQTGDRAAFHKLVDLYDKRLFYFIRRILDHTEDAYDVLQLVWLKVHRKLGKLKTPSAFRVWVYQIAHKEAISELRKKSRRPIVLENSYEEHSIKTNHDFEMVSFENAELIHVALQDLSVDHRRVLTLRFLEGMSVEEIAEVISCKSGTVKSRLFYAKQSLHQRIQELTDE